MFALASLGRTSKELSWLIEASARGGVLAAASVIDGIFFTSFF